MHRKISIFIHGLRGGGAEGVCVTVANGLATKGLDIDLVVSSLKGDIKTKELIDKIYLVELKIKHARSAIFPIWHYLIRSKPDVVLSFNRQLSVIIGIIRCFSFLHFKLISRNITFLSLAEEQKKHLGIWHGTVSNILIRKFFPLSDIFIAQCQSMKDDLVAYLKVDVNKILVIHNPVNKKIEDYFRTVSLLENVKENYLLCVGRLEDVKALHYAIEAFSHIVNDYPMFRLKILGKGSLEAQLRQQAIDLGIADKVDFEGYQEDIIPYYVHARLTMLTSLYEGFPNVLIDSIALGTPIVSFDSPGGAGEIVQDGVNGYLVRYQDIDHLTECLQCVLNRQWDPKSIRVTAERFSSEKIIDEYARVLT